MRQDLAQTLLSFLLSKRVSVGGDEVAVFNQILNELQRIANPPKEKPKLEPKPKKNENTPSK